MRIRVAIMVAAFCAAVPLATVDARPRVTGEEELARLLDGRVAGPPQNCITTWPNSAMRAIDGTAYVFGSGRVIYVNRTREPHRIDDDDILVIRKFGSGTQLCTHDIITTLDRGSQMYSGNVSLGDFIPYRLAK